MKTKIYRRLLTGVSFVICQIVLSLTLTSCVNDLHVDNINPMQTSELDANALLNKIYSSFVLTGQVGPDGDKDIADIDEGRSDLYRKSWEMNEFPTGEASWQWDDTGLPELLSKSWGADNASSVGLYYRLFFSITLCNYYLDSVGDDGSEDIKKKRAEVRFIRSLLYYYIMDLYANAAFIEHVSQEPGIRYTRGEYFSYIEKELQEIESDLAAPGTNQYGRVDKVAAWMLFARLYLNAEIYTGTPQWAKAKEYAEKVINNGYYKLNTTGTSEYSAYQMLFLADNDTNGAQYENIFPILNDGIKTQSHGSMHFLVLSTYAKRDASDMDVIIPSGTDVSWGKCMAVTGQLVDAFFGKGVSAPETTLAVTDITSAASDDRALFYTTGFSRDITDRSQEKQGYGCVKFRNVRSDGKPASSLAKVDTDLPLMRIAEAYLTYAEAETRLNGSTAAAKEKMDAIRNRAHAVTHNSYDLSEIEEEWIREFWFEGRARIDQIRFGHYNLPTYRFIYPIPNNDLTNNPNLVQNPGY